MLDAVFAVEDGQHLLTLWVRSLGSLWMRCTLLEESLRTWLLVASQRGQLATPRVCFNLSENVPQRLIT